VGVDATSFLSTAAIGLCATLFMDILALILKPAFGPPSAGYCLVGRWLCHMPGGTVRHANIVSAAPKRFECVIGWSAHYALGALYAFAFVAIVSREWLMQPMVLPAILFGIASILVPFLLMQPSFGLGIAASKAPAPMQARMKSLVAHTAFGVGLYLSAVPISYVLHTHF